MGTATDLTMALTRSPTMNGTPQTFHHQVGSNQQHSICQTTSNAMVIRL